MAPTFRDLIKRQYDNSYYCNGGYYYGYYNCYSAWDSWGRWVLLAAIIVGAFFIYLIFACITARRRRSRGMNPYPMTAWASRPQANTQWANQNQNYQQGYNQQGYSQPPPAYGGQSYGVAQPQPTYGANREHDVGHYAPPAGPPPGGKGGDQVVR